MQDIWAWNIGHGLWGTIMWFSHLGIFFLCFSDPRCKFIFVCCRHNLGHKTPLFEHKIWVTRYLISEYIDNLIYLWSHLHYKVATWPHNLFLHCLHNCVIIQISSNKRQPCIRQLELQDRLLYQELSRSWHRQEARWGWSWSGFRDFRQRCLNIVQCSVNKNIDGIKVFKHSVMCAMCIPALRASLTASIPS